MRNQLEHYIGKYLDVQTPVNIHSWERLLCNIFCCNWRPRIPIGSVLSQAEKRWQEPPGI